jgi:hypothetical protein
MDTPIDLYLALNVYRRLSPEEVVVYRCFKKLPDNGYSVQSADRIKASSKQQDLQQHEAQLAELFMDELPDVRAGSFPTLEEAISRFERSFDEDD